MRYPLSAYWNNLSVLQQGYLVLLATFLLVVTLAFGYCVWLRYAEAQSVHSRRLRRRNIDGLVRTASEAVILFALLGIAVSGGAVLSEFDSVSASITSLSAIRLEYALRFPVQFTTAIFVALAVTKILLWFTAALSRGPKEEKCM